MANQVPSPSTDDVLLRDVRSRDLPVLFEYQQDPEANRMAAFTTRNPADREAFMAHWAMILADDTIIKKSVLYNGEVAGSVVCFERFGEREVGYWIGKEYWGKGIATKALTAFLDCVRTRPLHARVAKHNRASIRVLEKCGFTVSGEGKDYANALGEEVEELILILRANGGDEAR